MRKLYCEATFFSGKILRYQNAELNGWQPAKFYCSEIKLIYTIQYLINFTVPNLLTILEVRPGHWALPHHPMPFAQILR